MTEPAPETPAAPAAGTPAAGGLDAAATTGPPQPEPIPAGAGDADSGPAGAGVIPPSSDAPAPGSPSSNVEPEQPAPPKYAPGDFVAYRSDHGPRGEQVQYGIVVDVREADGAASVGWLDVSGPIPPEQLDAL